MATDDWNFIAPESMTLTRYACGVSSGDRVRLRKELVVRDWRGKPTGKRHSTSEVWTVLAGNPAEPGTIWLRQPDGEPHTWDDRDFWNWFERVEP